MNSITMLAVSGLYPHPGNPRKDLGDIGELADSIKANGIFQNLTVVPGHRSDTGAYLDDGYTVIIGHRRLAAAKAAGLAEVPCVVAEMDHQTQVQTMLLENMQRSDLTVYEQAQGFQMLLDFGIGIDEIAEKSGFSRSTVRRRVKMMELDQEKLKRVSSRQLNLSDFDELAKVESIEKRNELLGQIGTRDFEFELKSALRSQFMKKIVPECRKRMDQLGIKELKLEETYGAKYTCLNEKIDLMKWETGKLRIPRISEKLFYTIREYSSELSFYVINKRAKKEKPELTETQKLRAKEVGKAWDYLEAQFEIIHEMRKDFIHNLEITDKNLPMVLQGAFVACIGIAVCYCSSDRANINNLLGIDNKAWDKDRFSKALKFLETCDDDAKLEAIYLMFNDNAETSTANSRISGYPKFKPKDELQLLYHWLKLLGYVICEIEEKLVYGTDRHYHLEEAGEDDKP